MPLQLKSGLMVLAFATLGCTSPCLGQTSQQLFAPAPEQHSSEHGQENQRMAPAGEQLPEQQLPGSISGTVVDGSGAVVAGARVTLTRDGQFSFTNVGPGPFQLTTMAAGFATQTSSGIVHPGENYIVPKTALEVATAVTDVEVGLSQTEVAQEEIRVEEKQRVLGVIPNFYVS